MPSLTMAPPFSLAEFPWNLQLLIMQVEPTLLCIALPSSCEKPYSKVQFSKLTLDFELIFINPPPSMTLNKVLDENP